MPQQLDDAEILVRLERAMRTVPRETREVFLAHRLERAELVEGMKRRALDVLGKRIILGEDVGRRIALALDARREERETNVPELNYDSTRVGLSAIAKF